MDEKQKARITEVVCGDMTMPMTEITPLQVWVVSSGRPGGEVYHRDVWIALSEESAEDCYAHALCGWDGWQLSDWLWGPHIDGPFWTTFGHLMIHLDGHEAVDPTALDWNGSEMIPAPLWDGCWFEENEPLSCAVQRKEACELFERFLNKEPGSMAQVKTFLKALIYELDY